jgi:hypothetical protein
MAAIETELDPTLLIEYIPATAKRVLLYPFDDTHIVQRLKQRAEVEITGVVDSNSPSPPPLKGWIVCSQAPWTVWSFPLRMDILTAWSVSTSYRDSEIPSRC